MTSMAGRSTNSVSFSEAIEAFEAALWRGEEPRIAACLPPGDDPALLIELLHVELEFKLKNGGEASVADYLAKYPELESCRGAVVALIESEFNFRRRRDPSLERSGFLARYAEYAAEFPSLKGFDTSAMPAPSSGVRNDAEASSGIVIAGKYILASRLGEGGMGEVWSAHQTEPVKRDVAIKFIKLGMDSRAVVQRFEQERQALALMDHPHIAKVFDGGLTEDRRPYFAMELVNGQMLTRYCDEGRLGVRARLQIFVDVCQAVQHAHQKGIVHRDLKPSNVLVSSIDGRATPKVIDFGVAKATGGKLMDASLATEFGALVGTLEYMSPEQAGFALIDVDTRADIYSLGVILYELLTGLRPFDGKKLQTLTFDAMIRVLREDEPSRPSTRLAAAGSSSALAAARQIEPAQLSKLLRRDLDWIVMKCLEKDRGRRYESAGDLARDVMRFLADEAVEARPPSIGYRLQKFLRRNKRAVAAGALLAAALVAGIAGTAWGIFRAELAQTQAEADRRTAEIKEQANAQITGFLVRTFQSADPIGLEGPGFHAAGERSDGQLARRMLDGGALIVNEHLSDQPLVRASLLDTMGNSYRNVGEWDKARELLQAAHDLRREHLGPSDLATYESLQNLAHLARDQGDYVQAEKLYRDVIAYREESLGPDDLLVAETKTYLAWMTFHRPLSVERPQFDQTQLNEAERLLLEVLKVREEQLPPTHHEIGYTLALLASVKISQPHQELLALSYATRALEIFRLSDRDTLFGSTLVELLTGEQHRRARRFDEAVASYLKVLALARRHLGDRHPLVILQIGNLAGLYRSKGDLLNAEKSVQEFLELARPIPALRSTPVIVESLVQYADEVRNRRSPEAAEPLYREAMQYARERPTGNEKNRKDLDQRLAELERPPLPPSE